MLSCCSFKSHTPETSVYIARGIKFKLLNPHSLNKNIILSQRFAGSYGAKKFKLNLITQITPDVMKVIGLSEFGTRIFTIEYGQQKIKFSKFVAAAKKIRPEYMLADMQLVYGSVASIKNNISSEAIIKEQNNKGLVRTFYKGDAPFIRISYSNTNRWKSKIHYQHLERGYEYVIENVPDAK